MSLTPTPNVIAPEGEKRVLFKTRCNPTGLRIGILFCPSQTRVAHDSPWVR